MVQPPWESVTVFKKLNAHPSHDPAFPPPPRVYRRGARTRAFSAASPEAVEDWKLPDTVNSCWMNRLADPTAERDAAMTRANEPPTDTANMEESQNNDIMLDGIS